MLRHSYTNKFLMKVSHTDFAIFSSSKPKDVDCITELNLNVSITVAFVLGTPKRTYVFLAPSVKEKNAWVKLLQERVAVEKTKFLTVSCFSLST